MAANIIRIVVGALYIIALGSPVLAHTRDVKHRQRNHVRVAPHLKEAPPSSFTGGILVLNPSFNIACQTRDRGTRAIPCDQPVWVYGSPCEIDLGLGRWRNCDEKPGIVHGGARGP